MIRLFVVTISDRVGVECDWTTNVVVVGGVGGKLLKVIVTIGKVLFIVNEQIVISYIIVNNSYINNIKFSLNKTRLKFPIRFMTIDQTIYG